MQRNPLRNWTEKLQSKGSSLSIDKIALYGKQILEVPDNWYIIYLYCRWLSFCRLCYSCITRGSPPLGHVHAGNVYVKVDEEGREVCCLGGHENLLIGYETCQRVFAHSMYSDSLDLKMFGECW